MSGALHRTPDGRHSFEVNHEKELLDDMEQEFDVLWKSGDMVDTDEENPRVAKLLERYDNLEKKIYTNLDDPFARMDEEEDWDEESEEEAALKDPETPEKEKKKLRKLKREAAKQKKLDVLTLAEQIDELEEKGLPKEDADALRKKYAATIKMEAKLGGKPKGNKKAGKRPGGKNTNRAKAKGKTAKGRRRRSSV